MGATITSKKIQLQEGTAPTTPPAGEVALYVDSVTGKYRAIDENGTDILLADNIELQKSATHIQWKYTEDESWQDLVPLEDIKGDQGIQGIQGEQGIQGVPGADGADGADGTNGVGVPAGGTASQRLAKVDGTDYNTQWVDNSASLVTVDTTNFNLNLSGTDTTVQTALETLDDLVAGSSDVFDWVTIGTTGQDYTTIASAYAAGKRFLYIPESYTDTTSITTIDNVYIVGAHPDVQITFDTTLNVFNSVTDTMFSNIKLYLLNSGKLFGDQLSYVRMVRCKVYAGGNGARIFDPGTDSFQKLSAIDCEFYAQHTNAYIFYMYRTSGGYGGAHFLHCRFYAYSGSATDYKFNSSGGFNYPWVFENCFFQFSVQANSQIYMRGSSADVAITRPSFIFRDTIFSTSASSAYPFYAQSVAVQFDNCQIYTYTNAITSLFYATIGGKISVRGGSISGNNITYLQHNDNDNYHIDMDNVTMENCQLKLLNWSGTNNYEPMITLRNIKQTDGQIGELLDRRVVQLKNTSASTITRGEMVVFKGGDKTLSGNLLADTSTTADDALVYGVCMKDVATGAYGDFLVEGYCYKIKVDGTDDIGAGTFLGTSTTAGIAKATTTAGARKAVSMEAYTTDDTNGIVEAVVLASPV